jgi:hypothetical protein
MLKKSATAVFTFVLFASSLDVISDADPLQQQE